MNIALLKNHNYVKNIISCDPTARITITDEIFDSRVFYEEQTINDAKLIIGKYCSIATRCSFFLGGNHNTKRITTWLPPFDSKDISKELKTNGDIIIENDVWIGMGAVIMSGSKIGTGSVIGAYSVVSGEVEPYSIMVGNPARLAKKRFDDRKIDILLKSRWWEWDEDFILENKNIIFSEDFSLFEELVNSLNIK